MLQDSLNQHKKFQNGSISRISSIIQKNLDLFFLIVVLKNYQFATKTPSLHARRSLQLQAYRLCQLKLIVLSHFSSSKGKCQEAQQKIAQFNYQQNGSSQFCQKNIDQGQIQSQFVTSSTSQRQQNQTYQLTNQQDVSTPQQLDDTIDDNQSTVSETQTGNNEQKEAYETNLNQVQNNIQKKPAGLQESNKSQQNIMPSHFNNIQNSLTKSDDHLQNSILLSSKKQYSFLENQNLQKENIIVQKKNISTQTEILNRDNKPLQIICPHSQFQKKYPNIKQSKQNLNQMVESIQKHFQNSAEGFQKVLSLAKSIIQNFQNNFINSINGLNQTFKNQQFKNSQPIQKIFQQLFKQLKNKQKALSQRLNNSIFSILKFERNKLQEAIYELRNIIKKQIHDPFNSYISYFRKILKKQYKLSPFMQKIMKKLKQTTQIQDKKNHLISESQFLESFNKKDFQQEQRVVNIKEFAQKLVKNKVGWLIKQRNQLLKQDIQLLRKIFNLLNKLITIAAQSDLLLNNIYEQNHLKMLRNIKSQEQLLQIFKSSKKQEWQRLASDFTLEFGKSSQGKIIKFSTIQLQKFEDKKEIP